MADLLPCPFCGSEAEFKPYKRDGLTLKCQSLGCVQFNQRVLRNSLDWLRGKMVEHWNTRASPSAAQTREADAWQERQQTDYFDGWTSWYDTNSDKVKGKTEAFEVSSSGVRYQFRPLYATTPPASIPEPSKDARTAFEEKYRCDANDPSCAPELKIWMDAWNTLSESFDSSAFLTAVQGDGDWADEFLAWYDPAKWISEERACAAFLAGKLLDARRSALEEAASLEVPAPIGNSAWGEARQEGWIDGVREYRDAIRAMGSKP